MKKEMPEEVTRLLSALGKAIKNARILRGERQCDVVEGTGLSQNIMTNIESGTGSAVSSLVMVLNHLNLFEDVVAIIGQGTESVDKVRIPAIKAKEPKEIKPEELGGGVSADELMPCPGDLVEISEALSKEELTVALDANPESVYRINKNLANELMIDPTGLYAVHTNSVKYLTPNDAIRNREVYYATTVTGANARAIPWTVAGFVKNANTSISAVIGTADIDADVLPLVESSKDEFLFTLRKAFSEYGIFVDFVILDDSEPSQIIKDMREVRGEQYKSLYKTLLDDLLRRLENKKERDDWVKRDNELCQDV